MSERPAWLTEATRATGAERAAGSVSARRRRRAGKRRMPGGVASSKVRFERRASQARRRPLRLLGVLAALVALAVLVVWVVGFSAIFATRTLTVSGLPDPAEQQAAAAAAAVQLGTPLARVDTVAAAGRVARIATVASVTVTRSWPSSVVVAVTRKVPVAALKNSQGQLQVVDASGVPYQTVTAVPAGVAELNATTPAPDPEGVRAAVGVLQLLTPAERATVSEVTVSSADLVTFRLGAVGVVWGGPGDGPKKLGVLRALLPTKPGLVDVSAPDTPVTR